VALSHRECLTFFLVATSHATSYATSHIPVTWHGMATENRRIHLELFSDATVPPLHTKYNYRFTLSSTDMDEDMPMPFQVTPESLQLLTDDEVQNVATLSQAENARRIARRTAAPYVEKLNEAYTALVNVDDDAMSLRIRAALESSGNARRLKAEAVTVLATIPDVTFDGVTVKAGTVKWESYTMSKTVEINGTFFKISVSYSGSSTPAGHADIFGSGAPKVSIVAFLRSQAILMEVQVDDSATLTRLLRTETVIISAIRHFVVDMHESSIFPIPFVAPRLHLPNRSDDSASRLWTTGTM